MILQINLQQNTAMGKDLSPLILHPSLSSHYARFPSSFQVVFKRVFFPLSSLPFFITFSPSLFSSRLILTRHSLLTLYWKQSNTSIGRIMTRYLASHGFVCLSYIGFSCGALGSLTTSAHWLSGG